MSRLLVALMLSACLTGTSLAQEAPPGTLIPLPADWHTQEVEIERVLQGVAGRLEMDQAQRAELNELQATHRVRVRELRALHAELNEALQQEDNDRAVELRDELDRQGSPWSLFLDASDEFAQALTDDQHFVFAEMAEEAERRSEFARQLAEFEENLPEVLDLDEPQRRQLTGLVKAEESRIEEIADQLGELWHDLYEARASDDEDQVRALERQLMHLRQAQTRAAEDLLNRVEPVLRAEQDRLLARYRAEYVAQIAEARAQTDDVRAILSALRTIQVTPEQKRQLRLIRREALRGLERMRRGLEGDSAELAVSVGQRVRQVLNRHQIERLETRLDAIRARWKRERSH